MLQGIFWFVSPSQLVLIQCTGSEPVPWSEHLHQCLQISRGSSVWALPALTAKNQYPPIPLPPKQVLLLWLVPSQNQLQLYPHYKWWIKCLWKLHKTRGYQSTNNVFLLNWIAWKITAPEPFVSLIVCSTWLKLFSSPKTKHRWILNLTQRWDFF